MTQEISYRIRFTFPEDEDKRELMLPSIDLFLRVFEEADRLIAGSLGLELEYHRALKELSESYFFYTVTLRLSWPRQILLGAWPNPGSLRRWMDAARKDLFDSAGMNTPPVAEIAERWDSWAKNEGLADALLYTAPAPEKLGPLLVDLGTALDSLGGGASVEFS